MTPTFPLRDAIARIPDFAIHGRVTGVVGLTVEATGFAGTIAVAEEVSLIASDGACIRGEVIALKPGKVLIMPHGSVDGIGLGCRVVPAGGQASLSPDPSWRGRVLNAFGEPIDGGGPLRAGAVRYGLRRRPPQAHARGRVSGKLDVGVRALNAFLTCCEGQRLGIFAGSGVGKSSLLSMIARNTAADVVVIGLIGERGREAREFIEDDLGEAGLAHSVVVVATSDEAPGVRRRAALATMTVAEAFRDQGANVLCLMDSVTRFAMAQREIGLAAGEPPTTKGYTPSVFALLPQLLERAGPGERGQGSITAFFTVLVDGDDHNEPIADAVRGILDGHIVLDRAIAERGRYPAVNILRSISRTMPGCNSAAENAVVAEARRVLAVYEDMAELIRLGAYKRGTDPEIDRAIALYPRLEAFLRQAKDEKGALKDVYGALKAAITA
ncbi:MAG: flagellar protein export ATPase FliI [Defluviicoccus sp.]|nr:flagellar protein export ATPase FliI [Defluviicoccus sp.]MDG4592017.1 flagellar protein export ATPase FliI [Defluviicoccus sp.]